MKIIFRFSYVIPLALCLVITSSCSSTQHLPENKELSSLKDKSQLYQSNQYFEEKILDENLTSSVLYRNRDHGMSFKERYLNSMDIPLSTNCIGSSIHQPIDVFYE